MVRCRTEYAGGMRGLVCPDGLKAFREIVNAVDSGRINPDDIYGLHRFGEFEFESVRRETPDTGRVVGLLAYDNRTGREYFVVPKRTGLNVYTDYAGRDKLEKVGEWIIEKKEK